MSDWSKSWSSVLSQGSDAFTEAKQRVSQAISQKDLDPQNIDWSKVSSNVISHVSDALTEARQLVNQAASRRDMNLQNVDQSKLLGNIVSRVTDVLTGAKQLIDQSIPEKYFNLTNTNWRSAMAIMSQARAELWGTILSSVLFALTEVNDWSTTHPYLAAGALILLSASTNIGVFLTLLQVTGKIAVPLCLLPVRLIVWCLGFRNQGVAQGSIASLCQASHYGGIVPRGSPFALLQSFGASMWLVPFTLVSLLSYAGAVTILGREWGWW